MLTLSVRSFQVPATALTFAWPPSLPSVPTSRATRVTSLANSPSCSTMPLTTLAVARNCPRIGRPSISVAIFCDRSPLATAPMTRPTSVVGCTRSSTSSLTESTHICHAPPAPSRRARWPRRPSLPTERLMRPSTLHSDSLWETAPFRASAISPATPVYEDGRRTEKSPR